MRCFMHHFVIRYVQAVNKKLNSTDVKKQEENQMNKKEKT